MSALQNHAGIGSGDRCNKRGLTDTSSALVERWSLRRCGRSPNRSPAGPLGRRLMSEASSDVRLVDKNGSVAHTDTVWCESSNLCRLGRCPSVFAATPTSMVMMLRQTSLAEDSRACNACIHVRAVRVTQWKIDADLANMAHSPRPSRCETEHLGIMQSSTASLAVRVILCHTR